VEELIMPLRRISAACITAFSALALIAASAARAQTPSLDELLSAVVRVTTHINPEARTRANLGAEREGSGVVIDRNGLVLTIGYIMVEAYAAEVRTNAGRTIPANVVGYDNESGFGLLRAIEPLDVMPMAFGDAPALKPQDPVIIAGFGGVDAVAAAYVVARREFAGNWEYLLDNAIFTAPPYQNWSGAALISREAKLVGIGSLIVGDAGGKNEGKPGNMFVPIDLLPPILDELVANGHASHPPHPWLGVTAAALGGHLVVARVAPDGPADRAGIRRGDIIVEVAGQPVRSLAQFYRKVWAEGPAGTSVRLEVLQHDQVHRIEVHSINRMDNLKLKSTF
jgi:S1-C subfamily serine protease